jgi:hypothetical protein
VTSLGNWMMTCLPTFVVPQVYHYHHIQASSAAAASSLASSGKLIFITISPSAGIKTKSFKSLMVSPSTEAGGHIDHSSNLTSASTPLDAFLSDKPGHELIYVSKEGNQSELTDHL